MLFFTLPPRASKVNRKESTGMSKVFKMPRMIVDTRVQRQRLQIRIILISILPVRPVFVNAFFP